MSITISNQNRVIRTEVETPPVTGATQVYVTLPNIPVCCKVLGVRVVASASIPSCVVTLVSSGGEHRAYTVGEDVFEIEKRVFARVQTPESFVSSAIFQAVFDSPVTDGTGTGCLHLVLSKVDGSAFPDDVTFSVAADVQPMLYLPEHTVFSGNRSYRVLRKTSDGIFDLTQQALRNGNPYLQGSVDQSERFTLLNAEADEVYIGMDTPFAGVFVSVPASESFREGASWEISTGSNSWNAISATDIFDETSSGIAPSGLTYTGAVRLKLPQSSWAPRKLAEDPLTVLEADIAAGDAPYVNVHNPARYWLRVRPFEGSLFSTPLRVVGIQPLRA